MFTGHKYFVLFSHKAFFGAIFHGGRITLES
jgi:hypothetical protein